MSVAVVGGKLVSLGGGVGLFGSSAQPLNPMFINFAACGNQGTTYYEGFPIYKNRVRESYGFTLHGSFPAPAGINSSGWPTETFDVVLWSSGTGSASQASWLSGNFSCGFTGSGAETVTALGGSTVSNLVQVGAVTAFTLSGVVANSGFTVGNVTQAVTDIFAYLPEYNTLTSIDNPVSPDAFTTEAIAHYSQYGAIRWMGASGVIYNTTTMTYGNRSNSSNTQAPLASGNQSAGYPNPDHWPQEWCAAFSMACKTGMWLNIPPLQDESFSYVTNLATALYAMVPAGTPIYLEIGDELWNGDWASSAAWKMVADAYTGGAVAYYAYQLHSIAAIFRGVFGARYGTDVRLVQAWQDSGNGVFLQYQLYGIYETNGWNISADLWCTSLAPYINLTSPSNSWTIAQIQSNLTAGVPNAIFTNANMECNVVMGLKYGLPQICYEGGWQTNTENAGLTNAGLAIMDSGMIAVMQSYYQGAVNSGAYAFTTYQGGIDSNDAFGTGLAPSDELTYTYPVGSAPRFAAIQSFIYGWTPTRNVVSASGSVVEGNCYVDNASGTVGTLGGTNYPAGCGGAPNYGANGYCTYLVNCTKPGSYTLVVNFTNAGSSGLTGCESAGVGKPATIISPSVVIPVGTNNVTIGSVTLVEGANYVSLGNPGTAQSSISINTLTFN